MKKERLTTYLVDDKKLLMQGFTKRNISGANQLLRANYANFNLVDHINI